MIIDTHAHLMFEEFNGDVEAVIERANDVGVTKILNVGCGVESSRQSVEMAEKYDVLYASLGLHPYDAMEVSEELMSDWGQLAKKNMKVVAIGECGLDYVKGTVDPENQKKAFRMQCELAQKTGLPLIVHNRGADEDCLSILKEFDGSDGKPQIYAVFHCFSSDIKFARRVWYEGHMTSFTGVVTYPKSEHLLEVLDEVPMDRFMVETDSPYLSPQEYRGKRNEPSYVMEIVKKIAEVKDLSVEEVGRISTSNALSFFLRMGR